ncbi:E3 ubiquitin-protein ligase RNF187 [Panthera tigris]|uniref:E3 ubiquitin-protein ligase RNF187 n=1 Tax=Panthera tigris TaxID=9694 RepID=UPI001C6FADCA|nr:E3 ubiquitin-protein ligase RNF187 [Panthera tigris]
MLQENQCCPCNQSAPGQRRYSQSLDNWATQTQGMDREDTPRVLTAEQHRPQREETGPEERKDKDSNDPLGLQVSPLNPKSHLDSLGPRDISLEAPATVPGSGEHPPSVDLLVWPRDAQQNGPQALREGSHGAVHAQRLHGCTGKGPTRGGVCPDLSRGKGPRGAGRAEGLHGGAPLPGPERGWSTSLPGPGRGRAHRCLDLPGESVAAGTPKEEERAPLPGLCNGSTAARIPRSEAHLCQDPAWRAPLPGPCVGRPAVPAPRVPVAILVHVLGSPAVFSIPVPGLRRVSGRPRPHFLVTVPPPAPFPRASAAAALALPAEAACALCQRAPREPVRADCGHRFCRACVVRFWAEEDGPFPCPECADDCWQRAVEPGRPPLSRRLLALEEAAAAPARDGPASEAALQLLCRADGGPLCAACRMAAGPEPPEWEPRWRKALRGKVLSSGPGSRPGLSPAVVQCGPPPAFTWTIFILALHDPHPLGSETLAVPWTIAWGTRPWRETCHWRVWVQENKGSVEIMRKDLNDARDLHGQAESAAAVWKGHVMDRRKKALTDYKKLRAFFAEEEERFLQEADKEEGSTEDEDTDPAERFGSLLQAVSELERRHRNLGLSMLLQ